MAAEDEATAGSAEILAEIERIGAESAALCEQQMPAELRYLAQGIHCLLSVYLPALFRWNAGQSVVWHDINESRADPSFVFVGLLASVINSVLGVRQLATRGLDRQARVVFRELTETGDLLLAVTGDRAWLQRYTRSPEDSDAARSYWASHLKPVRIRRSVHELAKELGLAQQVGAMDRFGQARSTLYAWLSKSAHVDYVALTVESFAADHTGKYNPNIGGRIGQQSLGTLQHLMEYLDGLLVMLALFLTKRHGWTRDRPDLFEGLLLIRRLTEEFHGPGAEG